MKADINPEYDYSIYNHLKIIRIVNPFHRNCYHTDIPISIAGLPNLQHYQDITEVNLRREFLYNPQDPNNVIYDKLALTHYQRYPIEKKYTHIKEAFQALYQMYKLEDKRLGESILYLATRRYLAMVYKQLYGNKTTDNLSKIQFAVGLPILFEKERRFVDDILRPLFIEAGWISRSDFESKLVFFGELETSLHDHRERSTAFYENSYQKIVREKRYMCCLIQRGLYDDSLTLTLDIIQMRFDKDFIAASRSSLSSSGTQVLTPQFMSSSKAISIQNWVSKKTLQLPRFLLSRIFAKSLRKLSFRHGDLYGYYLNKKYHDGQSLNKLIMDLMLITPRQKNSYDIDGCVDESIISDSLLWEGLDQNERNNLAAIRYREILEFFPSIDMSCVLNDIRMHAKEHEFNLHSADDIMVLEDVYCKRDGMRDICLEIQVLNIRESIFTLTRCEQPVDFPFGSTFPGSRIGFCFKALTMVELSNKLKEPVVLSSETKQHCSLKLMNNASKTREQAILERLPGYSFYVEAKITYNQQIRLYLHQVIETQNGKEKSTLPIAETLIETGDMYDTICDVLWVASQEHLLDECDSSLSLYGHYCNFKSRLPILLEKMFNNEISMEEDIYDLQNFHNGDGECSCCVQISHKMILEMGVKNYLKGIAGSIIACVRSPATFGKYEPKTIIITGSLLSEWTKLNNTLYRDFIWKQLEEELCLSIYQHQMKVHLIMSHIDVDLFPDEQLIKWEKYQQVIGGRIFLVDIQSERVQGKLYEDKGDRYELVPCIKIDGVEHWRFHLIQNDKILLGQSGIASRYYIHTIRELNEGHEYDMEFFLDYFIHIYMCFSLDQQMALNPFTTLENTVPIIQSALLPNSVGAGDYFSGTSFPIIFTLKPQNYDFKTRCSLYSGSSKNTTVLFSDRLNICKRPDFIE